MCVCVLMGIDQNFAHAKHMLYHYATSQALKRSFLKEKGEMTIKPNLTLEKIHWSI